MDFDILKFARQHSYRVRNLHDGYPMPPIRTNKQTRRSKGYSGKTIKHNAIKCKYGYVDQYSKTHAGWYICGKRNIKTKAKAIENIGGIVLQMGDQEAAGHIHPSKLSALLTLLKPERKRKNPSK